MSDLSSIFGNGGNGANGNDLDALFAIPESEPLPAGEYTVEIVSGRTGESRSGKARYQLRFKVHEGPFASRTFFDDLYLSESAWWKSGPLLRKLGIDNTDKLRKEYPPHLLARVRVTVEEYQGIRRNKLADAKVIGRTPPDSPPAAAPVAPAINPFAPTDATAPPADPRGDAWEHPADRALPAEQLQFSFGANGSGPYGDGGDRR